MSNLHLYPNRTACEVLSELRDCWKSRNFAYMRGLIDELQSMFNRMESALGDVKDIQKLIEERSRLKKEVRQLEQQVKELKPTKDKSGNDDTR